MGELAVMNSVDRTYHDPERERRQFKRFPMRLAVQARRDDLVRNDEPESDARPEHKVSLEVIDFSLGGLRGASALALRRNERVTLRVPPFGTRPQVDVTGRVVRCQRQENRFDVGIEFCQTRDAPDGCPWLRIPELFYMVGEIEKDL